MLVEKDTYRENFGFKFSDGGAFSLICAAVTDKNQMDYFRSSARKLLTEADRQIVDDLQARDSALTFKPYLRAAQIVSTNFELNHAGRKGSAVFIRGVTTVRITSSSFTLNKAVDVI